MVSLKPFSIISAVFVITLIVLTIIDRVFSDNEVRKCTKSINQLYSYRTVHYGQPVTAEPINIFHNYRRVHLAQAVDVGQTDDDKLIGDDRLKMFKKGFLAFNATEIHLINNSCTDVVEYTSDPVEFKEGIKIILQNASQSFISKLDVQEIMRKSDPRDKDIELLYKEYDRASKYDHELARFAEMTENTSNPETFRNIIKQIRDTFFYGNEYPVQNEQLIIRIDEYTIRYFKKFLEKVSIVGKDDLKNPAEFCLEEFQKSDDDDDDDVQSCTGIIKTKFNFDDSLSGSQIFDILYEEWSEYQILEVFSLKEEKQYRDMDLQITPPEYLDKVTSKYKKLIELYDYSLKTFYNQFVVKLDIADIDQMQTPEQFCDDYFNGASTSVY